MDASAAQRPPSTRRGIAERLWSASRVEFSNRGYHGARVQGIARRAGCNVALLYRHWASKKALYLEVLQGAWRGIVEEAARLVDQGGGAASVVAAYLDANLRDPVGAQIIIREVLDGGPFLAQLVGTDPALADPIQRAARALQRSTTPALRPDVGSIVAVLSIGGLAGLIASAHEAARRLVPEPLPPERWREQAYDLLLNGVAARAQAARSGATDR
jgi:AcrR family transcriptional regulator